MELQRLTQVRPHLNAYTFTIPDGALDEVRELYLTAVAATLQSPERAHLLAGGKAARDSFDRERHSFFIASYRESPLLWVSANNADTFGVFRRAFDALDITADVEELVDFQSEIAVYGGFYVVGNRLPAEAWHVDYQPGANAYTLLTPLFDLDPTHGALLYRDLDGTAHRYEYVCGEGIIVGDYFHHTTEPYEATSPLRVLVSITFGTDKLDYWDILQLTVGGQSTYVVKPCGHEWTTCLCLR